MVRRLNRDDDLSERLHGDAMVDVPGQAGKHGPGEQFGHGRAPFRRAGGREDHRACSGRAMAARRGVPSRFERTTC